MPESEHVQHGADAACGLDSVEIAARTRRLSRDRAHVGSERHYSGYYRAQIVLGGSQAGSTFYATQIGSVTYWP